LILLFELSQSDEVSIQMMDMRGSVVKNILLGQLPSGSHAISEDLSQDIAKGMYFVSIRTNQGMMTKKLVVQ